MEELILFLKISLGIIFFSAGCSKARSFKEHVHVLGEYKILPNTVTFLFACLEILMELIAGIFLLLGLFSMFASVLSMLLLGIYSFAIMVNLLKGRRDISCGCGGVVGNHNLSWFLIFRNIVLLFASTWVLVGKSNSNIGSLQMIFLGERWSVIFPPSFYAMFLISLLTLITFSTLNILLSVRKQIKIFFINIF